MVQTSILGEVIKMALNSIWAHKLRTFLTLLGIIVGVASVMVVAAGISGAEEYVVSQVSQALGSNSFILVQYGRFGNVNDGDWKEMLKGNPKIEFADLEFLRRYCTDCSEMTAELSGSQTAYVGNEELAGTSVSGVTANTVFLGNFEVEEGRFFVESEARRAANICVIGSEVQEKFFPTLDSIGHTIKVLNHRLRIVGVLEKLGSSFGSSKDKAIYMPVTTYQRIFGSRRSLRLRGKARSKELFASALDQVRMGMRIRHKLHPNAPDDFGLVSTDQINERVDEAANIVASVVIPITLISLLVGGIVIMNIMLVSVSERTFEIGIRKALGARRSDILHQFLFESFLTAALGGAIGLGTAWVIVRIVEAGFEFPMAITWGYALLAVGFSGGIGLIFGIYPAFKASQLDPIIAMTAER